MSEGLILLLCVLGLGAVAFFVMTCIRIRPECPQCESKNAEIYDSNVSEAWLDCVCHDCAYKWRIK